jgi:HTH-type transcriptional regulator/antitoxin HigA
MIQNEKQYRISKNKLRDVKARMADILADKQREPLKQALMLASLENFAKELATEIAGYEAAQAADVSEIQEAPLQELPLVIAQYKIALGLTQKEFAEYLGIKEQQLQRYEATHFSGISFKNLLAYLDKMGLDVSVKPRVRRTLVKKQKAKVAKKK